MTRYLVIFTALLFACGEQVEPVPEEERSEPLRPSYQIGEEGPECSSGANIETSSYSDGCEVQTCLWICSEFDDEYPVDVHAHFYRCDEGAWEITDESVNPSVDPAGCEQINN